MDIEDLSGKILGPYELIELLGAGGMGAVYRGYDASLEREAAIKVLSPELASEPGWVKRFAHEAKTAALLEHPYIVPVYGYNIEDGLSYIAMRLLKGGSLESRVDAANKPLSLKEITRLLEQLASALDYAHSRGVIHRDIKANNVMFSDQDSPFLVDFGISKLMNANNQLTETGVVMGTHSHMAPEQWRSEELTPGVDQYALGIVIYMLVVGRMPFEAPTPYGFMFKHLHEKPPLPQQFRPDLPLTINSVLDKALAKKPQERYPTVTDFAQAFKQAVDGIEPQPVVITADPQPTPPDPIPPQPVPQGSRVRRIGIWIILILLLFLGIGVVCLQTECLGTSPATTTVETSTHTVVVMVVQSTSSPTASSIPSEAPTATVTDTATFMPTATYTPRPSATATLTYTPSSIWTLTSSPTSTASPALTRTPTPTATRTMTPIPTVTPGTTIFNGTLTPGIPDQQTFEWQSGSIITIRVVSDEFDSYLILQDPDGLTLAENDDCGTINRSCITATLPAYGVYTVIVDSFDGQSGGAYTLEITVSYPLTATPTWTRTPTHAAASNGTTASSPACPAGLVTVRVSDNRESINIRRGPGTENVRVGMAYAGECLGVDGQSADGDWLHIHTLVGRTGWVLGDLTDITEAERESLPVVAE